MLINKTTTKTRESKYICDGCLKDLTVDERIKIEKNDKKKYDLCKDCWRKVRIIVEKHKLAKIGIKGGKTKDE